MYKVCLAALLAVFIILPAWAAEDLPQPVGWVNDFAAVISPEYTDKLNSLIAQVEEKTSSEIAVVTVKSIAPYGEQEYARLLFDRWKPGKKGKDNGVLVLLAIKERRWRIETGYGAEGVLTDAVCSEIGRNYMVPYFREAKFAEGLYQGVAAIAGALEGEKLDMPIRQKEFDIPPKFIMLSLLGILVGQVLMLILIGLLVLIIFPPPLNFIFLAIIVILGLVRMLFFPKFTSLSFGGYGGYYGGSGGFGGGGFGGFGGGGGGGGGSGGGW